MLFSLLETLDVGLNFYEEPKTHFFHFEIHNLAEIEKSKSYRKFMAAQTLLVLSLYVKF